MESDLSPPEVAPEFAQRRQKVGFVRRGNFPEKGFLSSPPLQTFSTFAMLSSAPGGSLPPVPTSPPSPVFAFSLSAFLLVDLALLVSLSVLAFATVLAFPGDRKDRKTCC